MLAQYNCNNLWLGPNMNKKKKKKMFRLYLYVPILKDKCNS